MGELEYQLTRFPSATHDDLADALSGLSQLLTYPKGLKSPQGEDDKFTRLVRWANQKRGGQFNTSLYPFARKSNKVQIPATVNPLE